MKKGLICAILTIMLFSSSMVGMFGIPAKYTVDPVRYVTRLVYAVTDPPQNGTDTTMEDPDSSLLYTPEAGSGSGSGGNVITPMSVSTASGLEYLSLSVQSPTIDLGLFDATGISDIPAAIARFLARHLEGIKGFFGSLFDVFPKMVYNIQLFFYKIFGKVFSVFSNVYNQVRYRIDMKSYLSTIGVALVPLDWQAMEEDGYLLSANLTLPFGVKISDFSTKVGTEWRSRGRR